MSSTEKKINDTSLAVYSDGACSGNPGPGGFGAIVLLPGRRVIELGGGESSTTNNQMELTGVIQGLNLIASEFTVGPANYNKIFVFTDSVYVIRGITQWIFGWMRSGWKNQQGEQVANKDLWLQLFEVVNELKRKKISLDWNYVRGHVGVHGNERCDVIAVSYSKGQFIDLFNGSAENYRFDITEFPLTEPIPEMKPRIAPDPNKKSWYIVLNGTQKLVFTTWKECEAAVKGRSGVKFKKVASAEEEKAILQQWGYKGI